MINKITLNLKENNKQSKTLTKYGQDEHTNSQIRLINNSKHSSLKEFDNNVYSQLMTFQNQMKKQQEQQNNQLELIKRKNQDDSEEDSYFGSKNLPRGYTIKGQNIRNIRKTVKISDSDSEDYASDIDQLDEYIIYPNNMYKVFWDFIIGLLIIYSVTFTPFKMSYVKKESIFLIIFELIIELIFIIDIGLNFFTAYLDSQGNLIKMQKKIKEKYIRSTFVLDIISNLPIEYFLMVRVQSSSEISFSTKVEYRAFLILK
jgi:hypothetical protein